MSNQQVEEASRNKDYIKLANSVFKKFIKFRLTADDRREIFLDAIWYSLSRWVPEKSSFTTYLCNNVYYKTQVFIHKKCKNKELTNCNLGFMTFNSGGIDDFENLVSRLHDNYKIPIIQKFVYNMTTAEIAQANGYNKSCAADRIKKGIEKLKKSV